MKLRCLTELEWDSRSTRVTQRLSTSSHDLIQESVFAVSKAGGQKRPLAPSCVTLVITNILLPSRYIL